MQIIKFAPDLFELVREGKKKSTVREGLRNYTLGSGSFEDSESGEILEGVINSLELKELKDLTIVDAKKEAYNSLDDLITRLKEIYPYLDDHSKITIVGFEIGV